MKITGYDSEAFHSVFPEASTASLEALKAYSAALKVFSSEDEAAYLLFFRRAVEIDPKFAMAHAFLGRAYGDLGDSVWCREHKKSV